MGVPIKVLVKNQPVFVCCNGCTKQAAKEADTTLKKVADLRAGKRTDVAKKTASSSVAQPSSKSAASPKQEKIAKALAKLSPEDRAAAEKQKFCTVLPKSELGSMGMPHKITIAGQAIFLCCAGCEEDALKDPQATLAKVEKLKQAAKTGAAQ